MSELLDILKNIGTITGTFITLAAFWGLIAKKPKQWIGKEIKEQNKQEFDEIKEVLKQIDTKLKENDEMTICSLRHSITRIYVEYKDVKELPERMRENLCSLYSHYSKAGGNSYVHAIFEEMMTWNVK